MKDDISKRITERNISEPEKRGGGSLQETKACYANVHLPDGWEDTIDPKEYFQANEETRRHLNSDKAKWMKWENLAGHLVCWSILFIFIWILNSPPPPPPPPPPPECHPFCLKDVPTFFKEDMKEINRFIKAENWGQTETMLENILDTKEMRNEPDFRKECLYCAVKTLVKTKKYAQGWKRFLEIRDQSAPKDVIPYSVMLAIAQGKYEKATGGTYGYGISVENAAELIAILSQIRTNYAKDMENDQRILLIEADAFLSSLGKKDEKFDLENQKNIALWEQFEMTLKKLLRHETKTRSVIFLQYRKWLKIKSFYRIPLYNERIVIGRYAYDESDAEKNWKSFLNRLEN